VVRTAIASSGLHASGSGEAGKLGVGYLTPMVASAVTAICLGEPALDAAGQSHRDFLQFRAKDIPAGLR
jgi:hypothetical protein